MKRLWLILAGLPLVMSSHGQGTGPVYVMTLEECIDYAMGYSYNREAVRLNEESREISYEQSRLERLPSVSASLSESVNHTQHNDAAFGGSYGLDASMVVYQGGSIRNTIEQQRLYAEQSVYQTELYDNELSIRILQTFLSILSNEESLRYQAAVVRASEEQLNQGQAQYAAGMILESDYLLLKAQYANDRSNIIETQASRDINFLALKGLLSMDMDTDLRIVYPDTTRLAELAVLPTEQYATERALATLPDLEIIRYSVGIAEKNLDIARSSFLPTVTIGAGIGSGHSQNFQDYGSQVANRFNQQAGVSVSVPIFNRGRTRANVAQSRISLLQTQLEEKQTELDIVQTVRQEHREVTTAYNRYETATIRENAYRSSFEAYRAQFENGAITAVELLQQQNNYISALNDYLQSKYTFILRRKILDIYMGLKITM